MDTAIIGNVVGKASINELSKKVSAVLLGLILFGGVAGTVAAWQQNGALHRETQASALLHNQDRADLMNDAIRADILSAMDARDPNSGLHRADIEKGFGEHLATLQQTIDTARKYTESQEVASVVARLAAPSEEYMAAARRLMALTASNPAAADAELDEFFTRYGALDASLSDASRIIEKHSDDVANAAIRLGEVAIVIIMLSLLAAVAVTVMIALAVRRRLVSPLVSLAGTMRQLGAGDLTAAVTGTERADELGDMANAMLAFRDQLAAAEKAKEAQAQLIVESIGRGLTSLASGDLTAEVTAELQPPFAQLKTNFNDALAALRGLIGTVTNTAVSLRAGSSEIAQASEDLAIRTESSAASLEETSAAVVEINSRLKATSDAANLTFQRADGAIATVTGGRTITDDAVMAMSRVSESAKGIDSVIEGLDKIAFQTRVLAMNAAVEAGRAGEAGRGFAVVADLVSALAMRAEEEAGNARQQLTATQNEVIMAVEMVQKVDGALAEISGDVSEVHKLLGRIADDNQAQSSAIVQISAAITAMDQTTQQNAAMVEETSAAARSLSSEVVSLSNQASKFRVGDESFLLAGAESKSASRPIVPKSFVPKGAAAPKRALVGGGAGEDWTSF